MPILDPTPLATSWMDYLNAPTAALATWMLVRIQALCGKVDKLNGTTAANAAEINVIKEGCAATHGRKVGDGSESQ